MRSRSRATMSASVGVLHAARAAHVAVTGEFHDSEVAREHRAPDQVDILALSPAAAKSSSSFTRFVKACVISSFVMAE